jgi:hypothetical protein
MQTKKNEVKTLLQMHLKIRLKYMVTKPPY